MQKKVISKSKLHCILVMLILFTLVFLSVPYFLIRLANYNHHLASLTKNRNETSLLSARKEGHCEEGYFPCRSNADICIPQARQCDGEKDCDDLSDEDLCYDATGELFRIWKSLYEKNKTRTPERPLLENCTRDEYFNHTCPCNLEARLVIFCDKAHLLSVPDSLSPSLRNIIMSNNHITDISSVNWPKSLSRLMLEGNLLSGTIDNDTFKSAPKLSQLTLSRNKIDFIAPGAFSHLRSLTQIHLHFNRLSTFSPALIANKTLLNEINLSNNELDLDPEMRFSLAPRIGHIDLDDNRISIIRRHHFSNATKLTYLSLANNRISSIESCSFENDSELNELNLEHNRIKTIDRLIFFPHLNIGLLKLDANPIETLPEDAFAHLPELESLHLQYIDFKYLTRETFKDLKKLRFIYFKKFSYCYKASSIRVCKSLLKTDGLSTFERLLAFPDLKRAVWIMALVCSLGNAAVLIWRTVSKHEDRTLSLFVRNLSLADLLMGIYLSTIAWQDFRFGDQFNIHADAWISSWGCSAIGFLATLSSELSVFLLTIITVERYRSVMSFKNFDKEAFLRRSRLSIAIAWFLSVLIALYPLSESIVLGSSSYYASNGLCLPLHIDEPFGRGWQFSTIIYTVNFGTVILMIALYARMYVDIIDGNMYGPYMLDNERHRETEVAVRFFVIVLSNCLCLIPIVVIKLVAFKMRISSSIYGWLVVFVIPINSALNPIIYTLANPNTPFCRLLGRLYHRLECSCEMAIAILCCCVNVSARTRSRAERKSYASDYSSSRSSASISTGSEAQLIGHTGRRRTKTGSACFESSVTAHGKDSKINFESKLSLPSYHLLSRRQNVCDEQHSGSAPEANMAQLSGNLLSASLDCDECPTCETKVQLSLMNSEKEPSTGTGTSSLDQETPSLDEFEGGTDNQQARMGPTFLLVEAGDPRRPRRSSAVSGSSAQSDC